MRLIDADGLLYEDVECKDGSTYMVVHAPQIDNAPTVFDLDKVVEQISELNENEFTLAKVIHIVKAGGIDE